MERDLRQPLLASETVFQGRIFSVRRDRLRMPDGTQVVRDVVDHPGAVVIVPITGDDRVILVRQYRHPAGQSLLELPAGTLEPGEDPAETAARELQEETGFKAGRLLALGSFFSAPGFCTELLHCFLAQELTPVQAQRDVDEDIEVTTLAFTDAFTRALRGELRDAKTLAALLLVAGHRGWLRVQGGEGVQAGES